MGWLWESIADLDDGAELLRRRSYGVIEAAAGRLIAVHLRPWPKLFTLGGVWRTPEELERGEAGDRCLLYYNQPRRLPNFLALRYFVSTPRASFQTVRRAIVTLDVVARIKRTDAIVCEAWNRRISDRALRRWGWERHVLHSRRRHYIKRFYGSYPRGESSLQAAPLPEVDDSTELNYAET
ncbi:MAG: hypothetical protein KY475_01005 [Planctomycetes bacterium]|nr:hypothetical protein [Planctomycetota bacterium]